MATLLHEHPALVRFAPYLRFELCRDGTGSRPRRRIELAGAPPEVVVSALKLVTACAACGEPIFPFRARVGRKTDDERMRIPRHVYIAVTCPLERRVGCSRGKAAAAAYVLLEEAVRTSRRPER